MQKEVDYKAASGTKYPEQVVVAIAKDEKGRANPVPLGWTMIASYSPAMMAIAVATKHYSTGCIKHSKCFTVAFPSVQMGDAVLFYGSNSGRDVDKFAEMPLATEEAKKIDSVLLNDAVANFECELQWEKEAGDHTIFVGRVVCSHVNTAETKRLYSVGPDHKLGGVSC
jgi:flavin reductase (DIM6/NTAB) family NADH-FMN oxidoreductase RutF